MGGPRAWRTLRAGAVVHAVGVVLTWLVPSPIGTNVERLAALFAPAVLLACLLSGTAPRKPGCGCGFRSGGGGVALTLALVVSVVWTTMSTVNDLRVSTSVPAWATHTHGVLKELDRLGAHRDRVEVVPARNHREAALFAPHAQLIRGWNRQLDVERGRLFYEGALDAPRYHAWLRHWAVGHVVVADGRPDGPAEHEAALVAAGQDWLTPVWRDSHWRIYRVRDAEPLVSPCGRRGAGGRGGRGAEGAARRVGHRTGAVLAVAARRRGLRAPGRALDPADRATGGPLPAGLQLYGRAHGWSGLRAGPR